MLARPVREPRRHTLLTRGGARCATRWRRVAGSAGPGAGVCGIFRELRCYVSTTLHTAGATTSRHETHQLLSVRHMLPRPATPRTAAGHGTGRPISFLNTQCMRVNHQSRWRSRTVSASHGHGMSASRGRGRGGYNGIHSEYRCVHRSLCADTTRPPVDVVYLVKESAPAHTREATDSERTQDSDGPGESEVVASGSGSGHGDPAYVAYWFGNDFTYRKLFHLKHIPYIRYDIGIRCRYYVMFT